MSESILIPTAKGNFLKLFVDATKLLTAVKILEISGCTPETSPDTQIAISQQSITTEHFQLSNQTNTIIQVNNSAINEFIHAVLQLSTYPDLSFLKPENLSVNLTDEIINEYGYQTIVFEDSTEPSFVLEISTKRLDINGTPFESLSLEDQSEIFSNTLFLGILSLLYRQQEIDTYQFQEIFEHSINKNGETKIYTPQTLPILFISPGIVSENKNSPSTKKPPNKSKDQPIESPIKTPEATTTPSKKGMEKMETRPQPTNTKTPTETPTPQLPGHVHRAQPCEHTTSSYFDFYHRISHPKLPSLDIHVDTRQFGQINSYIWEEHGFKFRSKGKAAVCFQNNQEFRQTWQTADAGDGRVRASYNNNNPLIKINVEYYINRGFQGEALSEAIFAALIEGFVLLAVEQGLLDKAEIESQGVVTDSEIYQRIVDKFAKPLYPVKLVPAINPVRFCH